MSKIIRLSVRLNMDRDADRQAWEYLQRIGHTEHKSLNRAVISAVNDYFSRQERMSADPYLETREKEDAFLARVLDTLEQGLKAAAPMGVLSLLQGAVAPPPADDESMDAALDFANSF